MTTPEPFDLDNLDNLHAAATPGPWIAGDCDQAGTIQSDCGDIIAHQDSTLADQAELDWIVALHNAYPAMAAEIRRLRADAGKKVESEPAVACIVCHDVGDLTHRVDECGNRLMVCESCVPPVAAKPEPAVPGVCNQMIVSDGGTTVQCMGRLPCAVHPAKPEPAAGVKPRRKQRGT
jgi:hypothetical protein